MEINMNRSCIELIDLPDEILLMIFKKLNNLEVLYSFQGGNDRLNKIIHDPIFTNHLNFVQWSSNELINVFPSKIIRNRFCLQILPEISMKIKWLDLESSSMKNILRAANYPNLYGLGLYNIRKKTAIRLFIDQSLSSGLFKNQIRKLVIGIDPNENDRSTMEKLCNRIFTVFSQLTDLIFSDPSDKSIVRLMFGDRSPRFCSSTLTVLSIKVQNSDACLYILDGRFSQLHTLCIDAAKLNPPDNEIPNQRVIPNLKWFSLSCTWRTLHYNELILPLLYRMSNLEKLDLDLTIHVKGNFIDGNDLKENILHRMSKLNQFTFNIHSIIFTHNQINFPSQENIEQTFKDFPNTKIITRLNYFLEKREGQCHVYSYPFLMQHYEDIPNNFPGGLYPYVRQVSLYDKYPFEHEFFLRISQSFPMMQKLSLINLQPQNHTQSSQSIHNEQSSTPIKYSHLIELDIQQVHDDYIEEFLSHTKTIFCNYILLHIKYQSIERLTRHFTRDSTRINCGKINEIYLVEKENYSIKYLEDYFPRAEIH